MTNLAGRQPYVLSVDEGKPIWFLGALMNVKAGGEVTGNAFTFIDALLPVGYQSSPHIHHAADELFYILEGEITAYFADKSWKVSPGMLAFLPRGQVHFFKVEGTVPCRMIQITAPAGFENFVLEVGEIARETNLPPSGPPSTDADFKRLTDISAKHNIQIIPPPDDSPTGE